MCLFVCLFSVLHKLAQKFFPCASLLALEEDGTKLCIFPRSHRAAYDTYRKNPQSKVYLVDEMIEVRLKRGQLLIFNALLIHYGPEYPEKSKFARLHTYLLHPTVKCSFIKDGVLSTYPVDFTVSCKYYRNLEVKEGTRHAPIYTSL